MLLLGCRLLVWGSESAKLSALNIDLVLIETLPLVEAALVDLVDLAGGSASSGRVLGRRRLVVVCVEGVAHHIVS